MLKIDDNDSWVSNWSNAEKRNAIFIVYGKQLPRIKNINIKLLVGSGENFNVIGEERPLKDALKHWSDYIVAA